MPDSNTVDPNLLRLKTMADGAVEGLTELGDKKANGLPVVPEHIELILKRMEQFTEEAKHQFHRIHDVIGTLGVTEVTDKEFEFYISMLELMKKGLVK